MRANTKGKSKRGRLIGTVLALVLAVVACIGVQPARADTEDLCTYGGAQALLEAVPVGATQSNRSEEPGVHARPKLGQLWDRCQFRLYEDGETITFREDDYILGGIAMWWTYEEMDEFGWSRAEAIEDLRLFTDRLEMATVTDGIAGPFEPIDHIETLYRDAQLSGDHIAYNQRGFIAHLPSGEYLVRWTQSYPGEPDFESTVRLLVTPD